MHATHPHMALNCLLRAAPHGPVGGLDTLPGGGVTQAAAVEWSGRHPNLGLLAVRLLDRGETN